MPNNNSTNRRVLIIIGPSASGKSTIVSNLLERNRICLTPTWTTRPRRHNETGDRFDHRFVSDEEFDQRLANGFFYETVTLFDLPYRYGLPRIDFATVQGIPTIMLRSFLLELAQTHIDDFIVYQIERPYKDVQTHMHERANIDGEIGDRLARYRQERQQGHDHAGRIIVNDGGIDTAIKQFDRFLTADFGAHRK